MTLRIISGQWGGRRVVAPKGKRTRPSTEQFREALFNILGDTIVRSDFLDLYAGSGVVGLEALSRGCAHTTFVERDRSALQALHQNISSLNVASKTRVICADVSKTLHQLGKQGTSFTVIFADPPYALTPNLLDLVVHNNILTPSGRLFIERPSEADELINLEPLEQKSRRRYGRSLLVEYGYS